MSYQTAISELITLANGKAYAGLILRKLQEISDALGDDLVSPVNILVASTAVVAADVEAKKPAPDA